ncbi:MAG: superinfection immunity protein [Tepidisphaeraceae bacterium]
MGSIMYLGLLAAALFIYFLPFIVADQRQHPSAGAIAILNIFLGWTFLGWVVALVWASTAVEKRVADD